MKNFKQMLLTIILFLNISSICSAQDLCWEQIGGPGGELAMTLAIDSAGTIFTATNSYVAKSSDHGVTWSRITSEDIYDINSILIHPDGRIFLGTEYGVEISEDGGQTWQQKYISSGVKDIAINQQGLLFAVTGMYGVYISVNNGQTWYARNDSLAGSYYKTIAVHPNGTLFVGCKEGIYRSTNDGLTWSLVNNGQKITWVMDISIASDSSILLASLYDGMFRSTDNGDSWNYCWVQDIQGSLAIAVSKNGDIYASSYGDTEYDLENLYRAYIMKSVDNGVTWSYTDWCNSRVLDLITDGDQRIFAAFMKGVSYSSDGGESWTDRNPAGRFHSVNGLAIDSAGIMYTAADFYAYPEPAVYRSADNGKTWTRIYYNAKSIYMSDFAIARTGDMFYAAGDLSIEGEYGGIYRSIDHGLSWERVVGSEPVFSLSTMIDGSLFACHDDGVDKYNESTRTWDFMGMELAISVADKSNGIIFTGANSSDGIMYRYVEINGKWIGEQCINGLPVTPIISLLIDSQGDVIAGTNEYGIYRTTDNGDHWQATSLSIGQVSVLYLMSNGDLYSGVNYEGVYRSFDNGITWINISEGLPVDKFRCFALDNDSNLVVGTEENGVYKCLLPVAVASNVNNLPANIFLEQNYPNPFNPKTTIQFTIPKSQFVSMEVYNLLGQKVATLKDEYLNAGMHTVEWNATGLASGVYLYRLQAGNYTETKKLILLR